MKITVQHRREDVRQRCVTAAVPFKEQLYRYFDTGRWDLWNNRIHGTHRGYYKAP